MANINANQAAFDFLAGISLTEAQKIENQIALGFNHSLVEASTVGAGNPNIITAEESLTTFTNEGTAVLNYHTLPTAAAGVEFNFICDDVLGIRIQASAGDTIRLEAAVTTPGGYIESHLVAAHVTLIAIDSTQWIALSVDAEDWQMDGLHTGEGTHGEAYWSTPAATILAAATPAKAAGNTTGLHLHGFTHTDNRMTYNGIASHDFLVNATTTLTKAGGGATVGHIYIAKNGVVEPGLEIRQSMAGSTDQVAMAIFGTVELVTNDYIELWVSTDDGDDLTVELGIMNVSDEGPTGA